MKSVTASAPGKLIISGEHAVVYGQPALVAGLPFSLSVTLAPAPATPVDDPYINHIISVYQHHVHTPLPAFSWTINSQIPQQSGFGSSAALAAAFHQALARFVGSPLNRQTLYQLVQRSETYVHGNPSGIDAAAAVFGGLILYRRRADHPVIHPLNSAVKLPAYLIIQSGPATESTKQMVEQVAAISSRRRQPIVRQLGRLTNQLVNRLRDNKPIFTLIRHHHRLLDQLGIVGHRARQIITLIERAGGAAKISGAGGKLTGSGAILAFHPHPATIRQLAAKHAWLLIQPSTQPLQ